MTTPNQGDITAGVDRHGLKSILSEKFVNVQFDRSKTGAEIQGSTVNNLLRGLFFINGNVQSSLATLDLPGGISSWDDILETIYVTLSSIMTAAEFSSRLIVLSKFYIHNPSPSKAHVLSGGFSFTYTWTAKFNGYLSRDQLHVIRLGVAECLAILEPHPDNDNLTHKNLFRDCLELTQMLDQLSDQRHCLSRGLQPSSNRLKQQLLLDPEQLVAGMPRPAPRPSTLWNPRHVLTLPSLPAVVGSVRSAKADRRNTLKEEFAKLAANAVTVQMDIFGAAALLDNVSDSDEDEPPKPSEESEAAGGLYSSKATGAGELGSKVPPPPLSPDDTFDDSGAVRRHDCMPILLPESFNLAQDPDKFDIWMFSQQEIAHQWTLVDHALFLAIPLYAFMGKLTWTMPRHRADDGALAIRRFIDRFNATSLWVTHSVLERPNAVARADLYGRLVELAVCFESLGNFSAVMATVTGLQQGCITRLKDTLKLVPKPTMEKLSRLQRVMSGEKNYQVYRMTVQQRASSIIVPSEWIRRSTMKVRGVSAAETTPPRGEAKDFPSDSPGDGTVPHLGAHLAEFTTIAEGNPDYLPQAPHSLNVEKLRLVCRSVKLVARLQTARYSITPVRLIATVINKAIQTHTYLVASEATAFSRKMFDLSQALEGPGVSSVRTTFREYAAEESDEGDGEDDADK